MAYMCGSNVVAEGTICSDGSPAKWVPPGNSQPQSTVTDHYQSNQDTRPVQVGWHNPTSWYEPVKTSQYPTNTVVAEAKNDFNEIYGKAHAPNASKADKARYRNFVSGLRAYTGSELGTRGSIEIAWGQALDDAASSGVNVYALLANGPVGADDRSTSSSSGGGGGAASPVLSGQQMHRVADQAMQQFAGREATNAEAKAVTKDARARLSDPNMDPTYMAEQFAKNTTDATEFAANKYMRVFLQSLGGIGG